MYQRTNAIMTFSFISTLRAPSLPHSNSSNVSLWLYFLAIPHGMVGFQTAQVGWTFAYSPFLPTENFSENRLNGGFSSSGITIMMTSDWATFSPQPGGLILTCVEGGRRAPKERMPFLPLLLISFVDILWETVRVRQTDRPTD